jgi:Uncharacterized protein conserved in bacteria (DUF2252)
MANSGVASVPRRLLPILEWIQGYRREWLLPDELPFEHQGRRIVVGQRVTQGSPDIFLGWGRADARDFYVRQLSELKGAAAIEELDGLPDYGGMCGWALALAHAKSGDAAAIAGYCGKSDALDEAIAKFALSYARQTEQDFEALAKSRRTGRIKATQAV